MRKFTVRDLTLAAMVAALYAVLGYFGDLFSLTFGPVQLRFAEALTVLPFLFPVTAPGLAVGCLITNLLSPYGPVDIIFGTLATAIAAAWTAKVPRWYLAGLPPILVNALILPPCGRGRRWARSMAPSGRPGASTWSPLSLARRRCATSWAPCC